MTRYTSIGFKRTHLEAGFDNDGENTHSKPVENVTSGGEPAGPPTKKRKRNRKSKVNNANVENAGEDSTKPPQINKPKTISKKQQKLQQFKLKRQKDALAKKASSEHRRQKRIVERNSATICFACRETGHAVKDCPKEGGLKTASTGICYRCGSRKHSLSHCPKPPPAEDQPQLPFASCFVCNGSGHLASSCPDNKEKGIYPNGGCCKLCGEKSHLAKDCNLRKSDSQKNTLLVGSGKEAGADEDDFHIISRKRREVDDEEKLLLDDDGVQLKSPKPKGKVKSLVGGKFHVVVEDSATQKPANKPSIQPVAKVKTVVF